MEKTKSLLDLLVRLRTYKALDRAAEKNRNYRATLKEQDKAYDELQKAGLDREQKPKIPYQLYICQPMFSPKSSIISL